MKPAGCFCRCRRPRATRWFPRSHLISRVMASEAAPGSDEALLDRLAARVVDLHLEVPAILALETGRPLSVVAGQAMLFFEPLVQSLFSFSDYRRYAALIERRESIEDLIRRIESRADAAQQARRKPSSTDRARPGRP
ncbi:MAG: hypothetical protein ACRDL7_04665 [Gaiellaceae bacterium]